MTSVSFVISQVLAIADPRAKIMATRALARDWRHGKLTHQFDTVMPERPSRAAKPDLLPPNCMPQRRRGKSLEGQKAMLHAFAHIERVAIDLALDMAGRFGNGLSSAFMMDWLSVAADEALHFALLDRRLHDLGSFYGDLPAHNGLWEAAHATRYDRLARLAVIPLVLEARGLDVSPATIARFETAGDIKSARIMNRIYHDEIRHVSIGFRWFSKLCDSESSSESQWQFLVKQHFRGPLKSPFNDSARESAGLTRSYYSELATGAKCTQ